MSGDRITALLMVLGAMTLVGSGLVRRRLPGRTWLPMALLWVTIIALAWAAATFGSRFLH